MATSPESKHTGIWMENGSGGHMSDLTFIGGQHGMYLGNQQFFTRNLRFKNCQTAIYLHWNWQWTFKSLDITNCKIGVTIESQPGGKLGVGSCIILDSKFDSVQVALLTGRISPNTTIPYTANSAILDNVKLINVNVAVGRSKTTSTSQNETLANREIITLLEGGSKIIDLWGQGYEISNNGRIKEVQGLLKRSFAKPTTLLNSKGEIFERSRPVYLNLPTAAIISVRTNGAKGDGKTDDTKAIRDIFQKYGNSNNNIIFFDHGVYLISDTIEIPIGTRIVGEIWAVIMVDGKSFQDSNNPKPVWKIGKPGDRGSVEMQGLIFQIRGPQPGAIMMQWHSRDASNTFGTNAMWDVHFRIGTCRNKYCTILRLGTLC